METVVFLRGFLVKQYYIFFIRVIAMRNLALNVRGADIESLTMHGGIAIYYYSRPFYVAAAPKSQRLCSTQPEVKRITRDIWDLSK